MKLIVLVAFCIAGVLGARIRDADSFDNDGSASGSGDGSGDWDETDKKEWEELGAKVKELHEANPNCTATMYFLTHHCFGSHENQTFCPRLMSFNTGMCIEASVSDNERKIAIGQNCREKSCDAGRLLMKVYDLFFRGCHRHIIAEHKSHMEIGEEELSKCDEMVKGSSGSQAGGKRASYFRMRRSKASSENLVSYIESVRLSLRR